MLGLLGSLGGSLMSGLFGMMGQNSANEANERLDSTKYQRASADMTAAGLNPMMMFGSGGATTPPTMQNTMQAPAAAMKDAANSAVQMQIADKTIDSLTEQIAKTNAEAANVRAGTPGLAARSSLDVMQSDAIKKIPEAVRVPIYQGGFGADQFKSLGKTGAGLGAAVASAKGASSALPTISISPPDFSSAKSTLRKKKGELDDYIERSPILKAALGKYFKSRRNTSVIYKQ